MKFLLPLLFLASCTQNISINVSSVKGESNKETIEDSDSTSESTNVNAKATLHGI